LKQEKDWLKDFTSDRSFHCISRRMGKGSNILRKQTITGKENRGKEPGFRNILGEGNCDRRLIGTVPFSVTSAKVRAADL